ncbi:hypothetical protein [Thalassospira xiamenensis]|uniref:hypothetical protein n=1 Tax=Thalassospira xiamenensis TaxID=220697 RepID=UPI001FFF1F41|nr:hypothetical protein [Thalassospira xiamenensis]MCK2166395.1 hypothetical protein [Thalassospira xiamenensis]
MRKSECNDCSEEDNHLHWRQGDFWLGSEVSFMFTAKVSNPLSSVAKETVAESSLEDLNGSQYVPIGDDAIKGFCVLSQTCDIVRSADKRPYLEVAPLVSFSESDYKEIRNLKRPAFAIIPGAEKQLLVVDLDRVMTIDKGVLQGMPKSVGCFDDKQRSEFSRSLARKRARFAFPDDFNEACKKLVRRIKEKNKKDSAEGEFVRNLLEIRVSACPDWSSDNIEVQVWLIVDDNFICREVKGDIVDTWKGLFEGKEKYTMSMNICHLRDITASDYVASHQMDLEDLSVS